MTNLINQNQQQGNKFGSSALHSVIKKISISILFIFLVIAVRAQQTVIPLYNGAAPGSENWNWQEKDFFVKVPLNANIVYNVTKPTLTVYAPESTNGAAVIICPGGALRVLNIETEGSIIAKELNKKGITAFVLKYRLLRTYSDDPWQEAVQSLKDTSKEKKQNNALIFAMATQDLNTALIHVKKSASQYKLDPTKIGVIGFSAGANLAINMATDFSPETRPAFIASIYGNKVPDNKLSPETPPLFISIANDDQLASPAKSVDLYRLWLAAKIPAELHIYAKGGHGLRSAPANTWIHRFGEWLKSLGFTQ